MLFTDKKFDCVPVWEGAICLYMVRFYRGRPRCSGPFRHDSFSDKMKHATPRMLWHCKFVQDLQNDLDDYEADRLNLRCL